MHHVGELGISVIEPYRDISIGTELLTLLIEEAKTLGLNVLMLEMYAHNERARHVYTNVGFQQTGVIPKGYYKQEKYTDNIITTLIL
jgi:RimJ/RimL family protein N-acetyltransferase